jgi:hypothetical protein
MRRTILAHLQRFLRIISETPDEAHARRTEERRRRHLAIEKRRAEDHRAWLGEW